VLPKTVSVDRLTWLLSFRPVARLRAWHTLQPGHRPRPIRFLHTKSSQSRPAIRHPWIRPERHKRRCFQRNLRKLHGQIRHSADRDGSERRNDWLRHCNYAQRHLDQQRSVPRDPV